MPDKIEMEYFPEEPKGSHPVEPVKKNLQVRRKILSAEEVLQERLKQYSHDCLCGKIMPCIIADTNYRVYACSPLGCGRIFLEDATGTETGSYYFAEQNEGKEL